MKKGDRHVNPGKGFLDLFEEKGKATSEQGPQIPMRDPLDPPQVGTTDGETSRRRNFDSASTVERTPRLLLRQEQPRKKAGRPRTSPLRNLEREESSCTLNPYHAHACDCGHGKTMHTAGEFQRACMVTACPCRNYTPARTEPLL
jgi:hypothetical protein